MSLRLLGGFQVKAGSGAVVALASKKARALLAYLALNPGRTCARDALTALLWAETADSHARHSLRQTLLDVRKVLGSTQPRALIDGEQLGLNASAIDVDVATFERLAAQGTRESLEQAAALYQGDLLVGLTIREAGFEEWVQSERERLRELALAAMARLLDLQSGAGPPERAIRTALRLLALDPLQEHVHRALIRLYERQGRRASALRQYQVCVAVLQRELGVEPEPATKRLYREILQQQQPRSAASARPAVPGARPRRVGARAQTVQRSPEAPLIGREPEMDRLRAGLREAAGGRGQVLLLAGEAGIGKTRLVEELRGEGARQGAHVLSGRFCESEQMLPLRAWVDAFRDAGVVSDPGTLAGFDPVWQAELVRLFPELGDTPAPAPTTSEGHVRLFEMASALVGHLAGRRPLLLILEDLHWADEMSVRLLTFLGRRLQGCAALLVGTARDEDLAATPILRRLLDELDRAGQLSALRLAPLSAEATRGLVRALARVGSAEARTARLADQVWAASEGNPFVIVEIMRAVRDGRLPDTSSALPLPQRVRDVITARLERLSETARHLAAVASVIGREFDFALLRRAAALDESETAAGIEELVRHRVLDAVGERFDFTHQRVRDVVYESLLTPRRVVLHAGVGAALEHVAAGRLADVYDRLAHHFTAAGNAEKAVTYLVHLADRAAHHYALEEALRLQQEAREYAERLPAETRDRRHLELVFRLAHTLSFLGRAPETLDLLLKEQGRLERCQDPALAGHYHFWLCYSYANLGDVERGIQHAQRSVEEAARGGDRSTMGKASFVLARESYYAGKPRRGITHGRQAIAFLEPTLDRWWLGHAHWVLAVNLYHLGDFAPALEQLERMGQIGESLGDSRLRTFAAWSTGWVHSLAGDHDIAIATCRRGLGLTSDPLTRAVVSGFLGGAYREAGDAEQASALLEEALRQLGVVVGAGASRYRQQHAYFSAMLAEAYLLKGQVARAGEIARAALDVASQGAWRVPIGYAQRALGRVAADAGDLAESGARLAQALDTFEASEARYQAARTRLVLAEVDHRRGETSPAAAHLREAHALFRLMRIPRYVARTEAVARELAVDLGVG